MTTELIKNLRNVSKMLDRAIRYDDRGNIEVVLVMLGNVSATAYEAADILFAAQRLVEKWRARCDRGFDPDESEETTAFWRGVRSAADELAVLLSKRNFNVDEQKK